LSFIIIDRLLLLAYLLAADSLEPRLLICLLPRQFVVSADRLMTVIILHDTLLCNNSELQLNPSQLTAQEAFEALHVAGCCWKKAFY